MSAEPARRPLQPLPALAKHGYDRSMNLEVVVYAGEDGYIVAECPALPGCASQGRTREETLVNIREAIAGWLEVEAESGTAGRRRDVEIVELPA